MENVIIWLIITGTFFTSNLIKLVIRRFIEKNVVEDKERKIE